MRIFYHSLVTGGILGALWGGVITIVSTIGLALLTGAPATPGMLPALAGGALTGMVLLLPLRRARRVAAALLFGLIMVLFRGGRPFGVDMGIATAMQGLLLIALCAGVALPLASMLRDLPTGKLNRHEFEESVIRFLTGFGTVFFVTVVVIPFFIMIMTSIKSQQSLLLNPLDYSVDLEKGWALFRSYVELFRDFHFGQYMATSFFVSVMTVLITLIFSVPGAYAVARLRFRGQAIMSRSILLIYMVPMIVLALPIYIAFSATNLRNSIIGILLIYPVTTIPVALYMLQGYFRGLPAEIEEAGLMDGLSRLKVIWTITLPLSLPAIASVSLYVFMIGWNEFLLAFMLLDDPSKFTLTRGVAMLNSSEIPRQHLMAGSVIATIPIMLIFLALEKFMTKGLTAGSVKG